jgi:hypothetical protein
VTTRTVRLLTVTLAVISTAAPARAQSSVLTNLSGTLRIQQHIPCDGMIDTVTPVTSGQIRLAPPEGIDVAAGKVFALSSGNVTFAPFSVSGSCAGLSQTRTYDAIGVQIAKAISFTAVSIGNNVYAVSIPKRDVLFYETAVANGEPETGVKQPSEDVTGTIDLANRTAHMHVVLTTSIEFSVGPFHETDSGTLTADISGVLALPDWDADGIPDVDDNCRFTANPDQTPVPTPVVAPPAPITLTSCLDRAIGVATAIDVCDRTPVVISNDAPAAFHIGVNVVTWIGVDGKGRTGTATQNVTVVDATPPTVSCTAVSPPGHSFIVAGDDVCGEPVIRLGTFVLSDGEQIKIEETGKSGATLIGLVDGFRHFHVGKGQAVITAIDSSGNVATAVCR